MREVILDTETTGLDPASGHRVVEIGCVELINHVSTGMTFQRYVNPERDMPAEALAVHGLTEEFLSRQPVFAQIAQEVLDFLGDATLVMHNAEFDLGFLNAELELAGLPRLPASRATDTVLIARRRFPGAQASLDALCRRFRIDNSDRTLHGALLDARLLAEVYLELIGGRQADLRLGSAAAGLAAAAAGEEGARPLRPRRSHAAGAAECAAHAKLLSRLKDPIWNS
jgi:DNA polymerase-3 subunit epsilon